MKRFNLILLTLILFSSTTFAIMPITGDSVICLGSPAFFSDSTPGGVWSSSDTLIAKIDTSGNTTGISAGTVTITYTVGSFSTTKTAPVYPAPSPIFGPAYVCAPGVITIYDTTAGGGGWWVSDIYDGLSFYGTSNSVMINGESDGEIFYVTFVDTAGCSASFYVMTESYLPPIIGDTVIYVDSTTTLHAPGGTWSSSDTAVATINSTTGLVTGISPGTTTISYTFGCVVSMTLTVLPPEGISILPTSGESEIRVFPNPATTTLSITSGNTITQITITNLLGQTIFTHEYNANEVEVDVADLPGGVYFVKVNGTEVRKFVKE